MNLKDEILKRASYLLSNLPCQLKSGYDIKMTLAGYVQALEGCELQDIDTALSECIKGVPVLHKWAPTPPEFHLLVRDAAAKRVSGATTGQTALGDVLDKELADMPTDPAYKRMVAKAKKAVKGIASSRDHDQWIEEQIESGVIKVTSR